MQLPYLRAQAVASQLLSHPPLPGALCESQAKERPGSSSVCPLSGSPPIIPTSRVRSGGWPAGSHLGPLDGGMCCELLNLRRQGAWVLPSSSPLLTNCLALDKPSTPWVLVAFSVKWESH